MSDRWVFLAAFSTVVLIVAGAFAMPQFFAYELIKSTIFVAISVLVFFGEDKFSYMLGVLAPLLWFILDLLLGDLLGDLKIMFSWVAGGRVAPLDTPLHGFSLVLALILVYIINRRSFGWTLQMQVGWVPFAQAMLVALSAALIAGLYPARRMSRMITSDALRSE